MKVNYCISAMAVIVLSLQSSCSDDENDFTISNEAIRNDAFLEAPVQESANIFSEDEGNNKVQFTNLTKISTNAVLVPGWSGGVVYSYVSSQSKRYTLGVILGRVQESGVYYGFYSKANRINSVLGVSRY